MISVVKSIPPAHYLAAALAQLFGELRVWAIAEHERGQKRAKVVGF